MSIDDRLKEILIPYILAGHYAWDYGECELKEDKKKLKAVIKAIKKAYSELEKENSLLRGLLQSYRSELTELDIEKLEE